jgi:hypothetical protein
MTKFGKTSGFALRLFCAMLLVALGFAHRPASAMPAEISAYYTLPDGSFPTICIPENGDSKTGKDMSQRCEACRVAGAVALPSPPCESADVAPIIERAAFAFTPERFHRLNFPPNAPPCGPPALPVSFLTA